MYFADTDVMIDILRGYPPAVAWYEAVSAQSVLVLSGYVVMELLTWGGIHNKRDLHQLYDVLADFSIYWASPDSSSAAMQDVYRKFLGHSLEPMDALIGHCAREHGAVLFTFNQKHFDCIDGLISKRPYAKPGE